MNNSYNIIFSNNISTGSAFPYSNPTKRVKEDRLAVFKVLDKNRKQALSRINAEAHNVSKTISSGKFNNISQEEVVSALDLLNTVSQDGYIYTFDLETIGKPMSFDLSDTSELARLHQDNMTVTEFALRKVKMKNGRAVEGSSELVTSFTTSRADYSNYLDKLFGYIPKDKKNGINDKTSISVLSRFAGYNNSSWVGEGAESTITKFHNNANILDITGIRNGAKTLSERANLIVGSEEYLEHMGKVYDEFKFIANSNDTLISGMNIYGFDLEFLKETFKQAMPNRTNDIEETFEALRGRAFDTQIIADKTIAQTVFEDQNKYKEKLIREASALEREAEYHKGINNEASRRTAELKSMKASELRKQASSIENDLTLKNSSVGAQERGMSEGLGEAHTAAPDTKASEEFLLAYHDEFMKARDEIQNEIKANRITDIDKKIFKANGGAYIASDDDVFFSIENGHANTYNPTLMEKGHGYKITNNKLNVNDLDVDEATKKRLKGMNILAIKDLSEEYDRESFIAYRGTNKLQEILNTGNIEVVEDTKINRGIIKSDTKRAIQDKIRVKKENFYKINSNDGYRAFNNYFTTYNNFLEASKDYGSENTFSNFKRAIQTGVFKSSNGEEIVDLDFTGSLRNPNNYELITENARNMIGLYEDFNSNYNTYKMIDDAVRSVIGDGSVSKSINHENNRRIATAISARTLYSMQDEMYKGAKSNKILNFITKNNKRLHKEVQNLQNEYKVVNNVEKVDYKTLQKLKREAFFNVTGETFSKESDIAKRLAFGGRISTPTSSTVNTIDFLNHTEGYSKINTSSKKKLTEGLENLVYRITSDNKDPVLTRKRRDMHLKSMAVDLYDRGLIDEEALKYFNGLSYGKVKPKVNFLASKVLETKGRFDNLILRDSGLKTPTEVLLSNNINFLRMSDEEVNFVRSFRKNMHVGEIIEPSKKLSFLGQTFDKAIEEYGIAEMKNKISNVNIAGINIYGTGNKEVISSVKESLMDANGLNWEEKHADLFIEKVLKNKDNDGFTYANGFNNSRSNGLTHRVVEQNSKYYMVTSSKDKEKMIMDMLVRNDSIDDISKKASIFELPKRSKINANVTAIQRGGIFKAVTNDIVAVGVKENGARFETRDTIEEMVESLGNQIKYAKKEMEEGNIKGATAKFRRSWTSINEAKALTGTGFYAEELDGKLNIVKKAFVNDSDNMLGTLVNQSELVKALPIIFNENTASVNELRDSFIKSVDATSFDYFLEGIRTSTKTFDNMSPKEKLWYMKNIDKIASEISQNKSIALSDSMEEILTLMKTTGVGGFMGKDSGEVVKGFYNLIPQKSISAGSEYSNIIRPLINQLTSADVVSEESMNLLAKHKLYGSIANEVEEGWSIFDVMDLRRGQAYVGINEQDLLENGLFKGISVRRKEMTSREFLKLKDSLLSDDGKPQIRAIAQSLLSNNVQADEEEIIRAIQNIFSTSNLYEDQGLAKISLGTLFSTKGIKQYSITDGFKKDIGDTLKSGDILGYENGSPIKYSGKNVKIVGKSGDKISVSMFNNYNSFKAGFGYEKAEMTVPTFSTLREAEITDSVFEYLFKADVLHNPNIQKHGAYTTVVSPYMNMLTDSIQTEEDAKIVNSLFSKYLPDNKHEVRYNEKLERWQVKEVSHNYDDIDYNTPQKISDMFDELSSYETPLGQDIKDKLSSYEKDRVAFSDMRLLKDNTIENSQFGTNVGQGASISSKGLSVMGEYLGDEGNSADFLKYMDIKDGKMVSKWKPIKDYLENMIMQDPKNIKLAEQAVNIEKVAALMLNQDTLNGQSLKAFKDSIVDVSLDDIANYSGMIDANDLTEVFKYTKGGPGAYRINLKESGIEIPNFIYDDLKSKYSDIALEKMGITPTVGEILIPAIDPNFAGENFAISELQKKYSNLLNTINEFRSGAYNGSFKGDSRNLINTIKNQYREIGAALTHEMSDKKGILKAATKTKAKYSASTKMMKISAPVLEGGQYLDDMYRNKSTIKLDSGQIKYRQVAFRNTSDIMGGTIESAGEKYLSFAQEILTRNVDNSDEFFEFLKGYDIAKNAKDIQEAKRIISRGFDEESMKLLAKDYIEEVGFFEVVYRDPTFRPESFQIVRTFGSDRISEGTSSIDAVTGKLLNADADGDEIRFINMLFFGEKELKLRSESSDIIRASRSIQESLESDNLNILRKLEAKNLEMEKYKKNNLHILKNYVEEVSSQYGLDYIPRSSSGVLLDTEVISRITKGEIGQISSTNYNLKNAATSYMADVSNFSERNKIRKIIHVFSRETEQGLIDTKSIKKTEDAIGMLNRIKGYRSAFDNIAYGSSKETTKRDLMFLANNLSFLVEDGIFEAGGLDLTSGRVDELNDMVNRIMAGEIIKGSSSGKISYEEALYTVKEILESDNGKSAFFHSGVRQSVMSRNKFGEVRTETAMLQDLVSEENFQNYEKIFGGSALGTYLDKNHLDNTIFINNIKGEESMLAYGDTLVNLDDNPGVFRYVDSTTSRYGSMATFENIETGDKFSVKGKDFNAISNQLNDEKFAKIASNYEAFESAGEIRNSDDFIALSKNVDDIAYSNRKKRLTTDLEYLTNALDENSSLNRLEKNFDMNSKILEEINPDVQLNALLTAESMKNNKMINDDEATALISSINEKIKTRGTKEYRAIKEEAILENQQLVKKYSLAKHNVGAFIDDNLSDEMVRESYKKHAIQKATGKLNKLERLDVDSIVGSLNINDNDLAKSVRELLNSRDNGIADNIKEISSRFLTDSDFQKSYLGWDLDKINNLIGNNNIEEALSFINKSKIAYGRFTGYSIGNLDKETLNKILYETANIGGIDDSVKAKMNYIIDKAINLDKDGIREVTNAGLKTSYKDNIVTELMDSMVQKTYEKGNEAKKKSKNSKIKVKLDNKTGGNTGKSLIEQLGDSINNSRRETKILMGAAAGIGALALGAYLYGGDVKDDEKQAEFKNNYDNVKTSEPSKGATNYSNVPMTDSRFYASQNTGLNMNVSGRAPAGRSIESLSNDLSNIFKGGDLNINTHFKDSRKQVNEKEIDEIMYNSTF